MADRLALAFALILLPTAAAAQLSAVGVSVALNHHQYADVQSLCCPPLAWATFGEGPPVPIICETTSLVRLV